MTLDYPEDYKFFRSVMVGLKNKKTPPTFSNIIDYLNDHPEVVKINTGFELIYEKHLKSSILIINS